MLRSLVSLTLVAASFSGLLPSPVSGATCDGTFNYLNASSESQFLTSPNYPHQYFNNELCRWVLQASRSYQIINFRFTNIRLQVSANCAADYVEVKDGDKLWSAGIRRYCGASNGTATLLSTTSAILVIFRTGHASTDKGFRLEYWTAPKGETEFMEPSPTKVHLVLYGVFGFIVSSILLLLGLIVLIRRSPALYNRLIWRQPPDKHDPPELAKRSLSIISVREVNGRHEKERDVDHHLTKHITASSANNLIEVG